MKNKIKMSGVLLAVLLCFTSTTLVYAAGYDSTTNGSSGDGNAAVDSRGKSQLSQSGQEGNLSNQDGTLNNPSDSNESGNGDTLRERTRLMDQTCNSLKEQLSNLENTCNDMQNQYQTALKQQNQSEANLLKERLQLAEQKKGECIKQLNQIRMQLKETVRASYTEEEMARIKAVETELKQKYPDDKVLPVESIIPLGFNIKFDTPPVIRSGRTLVPVRALVEGMGATVEWNEEDSSVVIEKGNIKIQLQLRNRFAYVNGREITLDVLPETINNRTVVPLRFILQQLGYAVDWDTENELIEITSPEL